MNTDDKIEKAFSILAEVRRNLPDFFKMKIWLSYNGTLSYTISANLHPAWRYDKRWEPKIYGQFKGENYEGWAEIEAKRIAEKILKYKEYYSSLNKPNGETRDYFLGL